MATRANIRIVTRSSTDHVYRHWDGDLRSVGVDLLQLWATIKDTDLNKYHNRDSIRSKCMNFFVRDHGEDYKFTTELHGDIEWSYTVDLTCRWPFIRVAQRVVWGQPVKDWATGGAIYPTPEKLARDVNRLLDKQNDYIRVKNSHRLDRGADPLHLTELVQLVQANGEPMETAAV